MEIGKLETEEERYIRRHKRYLKAREEGKNSVYHKDKNGNKVKSKPRKYIRMEDLSEEEKQIRRDNKHRNYLKSKELDKPYVYHRKKEFTEEERERRRLASAQWRKDHPARVKENMQRWHKEHYEEEKRSWQEYRRNNKKLCIEYLGSECSECGGVFHPDVYDFHHKDTNEKDICVGKLLTRKFENIKVELDKCILVCSNCHRIIHAQY